jgi:hypothetical protein
MGLYGANGIRPGRPPVAPTEKSPLTPLYERGEYIAKLAPKRQNLGTSKTQSNDINEEIITNLIALIKFVVDKTPFPSELENL